MPWGVGSDYSELFFSDYGALLGEMEILEKEVGFSAAEVISAATATNARIMGLGGEVGELKEGQWADFIAVNGRSLQSVSALQNISHTVKRGNVYDWATLSREGIPALGQAARNPR